MHAMTETPEDLFSTGIERYKAGEGPETLIPLFKEICERSPKSSNAWTCLAWLYLLDSKPVPAYKAAQKAVKWNGQDPQARVNLAVAMIDGGQKGVREHIEIAQQILLVSPELREEVLENIKEGLTRKPDWQSLQRVQTWLLEA